MTATQDPAPGPTARSVRLLLGTPVLAQSRQCGRVMRIVVDPNDRVVTHLAVGSAAGDGRLVPFELVDTVDGAVHLSGDRQTFDALRSDQDQGDNAPYAEPDMSGQTDMVAFSYFATQVPGPIGHEATVGVDPPRVGETFDRVPAGQEQLRSSELVQATDGPVGHVTGVEAELRTGVIRQILIDAGHFWNRHQLAVAIDRVEHFGISVRLDISKQELRATAGA